MRKMWEGEQNDKWKERDSEGEIDGGLMQSHPFSRRLKKIYIIIIIYAVWIKNHKIKQKSSVKTCLLADIWWAWYIWNAIPELI